MENFNIEKWGKKIIDDPDIRFDENNNNITLITQIIGLDLMGYSEFANDFNFKLDLWYLVSRNLLNEDSWNNCLNYFAEKYGNITSTLKEYRFEIIKDMVVKIVNINHNEGIYLQIENPVTKILKEHKWEQFYSY